MLPDYDDEDVPLHKLTIEVFVTGWDDSRAIKYIEEILNKAKREDECQVWDVEVKDSEIT